MSLSPINQTNLFSLDNYLLEFVELYNKVQKGFIKLSNKNKKKYQIINSNLDIKLNEKLVLKKIEKLIR